jgi:hypothetical protein
MLLGCDALIIKNYHKQAQYLLIKVAVTKYVRKE